jgi:DNA-directed RNA polymerase subunit RPC12/RpoP
MNITCDRCGQNMGFTTLPLPEEEEEEQFFYCVDCKSKLLEGMSVNKC